MQGIKKDIELENEIRKLAASGGGGSQDLDSVLTVGDTAINKDIVFSDGGANQMTINKDSISRNNAGSFTWNGSGLQIISSNMTSAVDAIQIQSNSFVGANSSILINSRSTGTGKLKLKTATDIEVDLPIAPVVGQALLAKNVGGDIEWGNVAPVITAGTPSSAATAGTAGELQYDGTYIYICTNTGGAGAATWQRTQALTIV